jgi:hypothetical protein
MKKEAKKEDQPREDKDLRYRKQHFPGGDKLVFDTNRRGFIPLPIVLRKLLRVLSAPELRVLIYLSLRASRYFICYPTLEEIAYDLGVEGTKSVKPHVRTLENKRFISTRTAAGKKYFLIHDPRVAIEHMVKTGDLTAADLFEINELLRDLKQSTIVVAKTRNPESEG